MNQTELSSILKDNLKALNLEDFLTYGYYIIDEIFQEIKHFAQRSGPSCTFSDSEVICLNLVGQLVTDSEFGWHSFVKKII